eukprot:SAG31_NODE_2243_length_6102_cov_5.923205_1_plen_157_part_00
MATPPPCVFYARGQCRNGQSCRFSHQLGAAAAASSPEPAPAPRPPCRFFASGACRAGNSCRFSHEQLPARPGVSGQAVVAAPAPPPPPPLDLPPGAPLFSIDVECVASGVQHNDRSTGQIALVSAAVIYKDCCYFLSIFVGLFLLNLPCAHREIRG